LKNGCFSRIVITSSLKVNDVVYFSKNQNINIKVGDSIKLRYALKGFPLHNLESYPGSGPVYAKAGGVSATLLSKTSVFAKVRLSSGEERLFDLNCMAIVGIPSNIYNKFHKKYKAGTNRLLNRRPIVRGVAMNPIDHPHGGGAGKTGAKRPSVSP
jgi:large subunit ribosomal protein L2